jgi:FixJ family two-component response regulator
MINSDPVVYVVDDDPSVLKAVSRLLRAAGYKTMTFASPNRFLNHHERSAPACLVLDLAMPGLDGLQLQEMLASTGDALPIIFLTGRGDVPASVKAMKRGAADFLTKPVEREQLLSAVQTALEKDRTTQIAEREVADIRSRLATLTPREYEVLQHVISGQLNKQTAADIGAAEKTVKVHRARVMDKMKVQSVAELVRLTERAGIAPALLGCDDQHVMMDGTKVQ